MNFKRYKYIDDTDRAWVFKCSDFLAAVGGLEEVLDPSIEHIGPIGSNYKLRHIKLVALAERPGLQKYRTEVIINERDPSKFLGKIIIVEGIDMRCIKYVGEKRTGR